MLEGDEFIGSLYFFFILLCIFAKFSTINVSFLSSEIDEKHYLKKFFLTPNSGLFQG